MVDELDVAQFPPPVHEWPDDEIRLKPPNWVTIAPRYPPEKWDAISTKK